MTDLEKDDEWRRYVDFCLSKTGFDRTGSPVNGLFTSTRKNREELEAIREALERLSERLDRSLKGNISVATITTAGSKLRSIVVSIMGLLMAAQFIFDVVRGEF